MSETIEAPRDDAGKFTPSTEGLTGRELANAESGFRTRPRDPEPEAVAGDAESLRELAANRNDAKLPELSLSVTEVREASGGIDTKEAVSLEQAAKDLATARADISKFADGINFDGLANEVDQKRLDAIEGDKAKAKHFGFELGDGAKPEAKSEAGVNSLTPDDQVDAATAAAIDAVEGLDETTKRALKIPQVRAAIEQQLGEVDTARQQLATERALAQQFAQASFLESFPELAALPPQHLEAGLQQLAQQNPQRFAQAMGILNRVQSLQATAQQTQQVQAYERRYQFENTIATEDARLTEMFGGDKAASDAVNAATLSYLAEHGVPRHQMVQVFMDNPVLSSAEARKTIWEAAEYRKIKAAPKAVPQALPPVQRPGVNRPDGPRVGDNSAKIQSLQKQLVGAHGSTAARIAGQIRSLKRSTMTDEPTAFEKITQSLPNHTGEPWSPERTRADFHLFSHAKRAEALDLIDDHMSRTEPSNIRDYARLSKLRRELASTHATLRAAGR